MEYAIGIDIGGTYAKLALLERPATLIAAGRVETAPDAGPEALVERCAMAIGGLCAEHGRRLEDSVAVGIGLAGLVDQDLGGLAAAPNLSDFIGVPVRDAFARRFDRPAFLDNDANLWAFGEALLGAGKGCRVVLVLSLGTGVGGGLVDRGRILHGARGMAAEFGHMTLHADDGPACACGQRGCLEAYVNAGAVVSAFRTAAERRPDAVGTGLARGLRDGSLTARMVGEAAGAGDLLALTVFEEVGRYLGLGIANLVNAFNPDVVVIGGGVALVGAPLLDRARRTACARLMAPLAADLHIRPAALGDQGGVLGAALMALGAAVPTVNSASSGSSPPGDPLAIRPPEPGR